MRNKYRSLPQNGYSSSSSTESRGVIRKGYFLSKNMQAPDPMELPPPTFSQVADYR